MFDDGIDLIEDPSVLEGRWYEDWSRELEQRLEQADVVLTGNVTTLHADLDLSRNQSYRVIMDVERTVKGAADGSEVSLVARESAKGYPSLDRNKERLLNQRFVAFVKYAKEDEQVVGHFHLVPPSDQVLTRLKAFEEGRKPRNVTVFTHSN